MPAQKRKKPSGSRAFTKKKSTKKSRLQKPVTYKSNLKHLIGQLNNIKYVILWGLIGAIVFGAGPIIYQNVSQYWDNQTQNHIEQSDFQPTRISIPQFKLTIPIKEATVSGNQWDIFNNEASWLKDTGNLQIGNIIIYAHNKKFLFGRLPELPTGAVIQLESKAGIKEYTITETIDGTPEDIEPLLSNENQLTLYTCDGWWDTKRYIVIAKPSSSLLTH